MSQTERGHRHSDVRNDDTLSNDRHVSARDARERAAAAPRAAAGLQIAYPAVPRSSSRR